MTTEPSKRATARQVADLAGVSPTTVSFVLNDVKGANISPATQERVRAAAESLGYAPSAAARSLVSGKTKTVGLVVGHAEHLLVDVFIPQLLFGLNQVARKRGYRVLIEAIEDVHRSDAYTELVHARHIDGLVLLNPRSDDQGLGALLSSDFPTVTLGKIPGFDTYRVYTNDRVGMRLIAAHLAEIGHTKVGHVTFSPRLFFATEGRLKGMRQGLADHGLELPDSLIEEGNYSAESGYHAANRLLDRHPDLTAIACGNDTVAIGVLLAVQERGLRVPDDVAVAGYDDIPTARWMTPPLTTVRSDAVASGKRSMGMLADLMEGRTPAERHVRLNETLLVRRSTVADATMD